MRTTTFLCSVLVLCSLLTVSGFTSLPSVQDPGKVNWTPPPSRAKEKTLFAPRPLKGGNIFKGEAEQWLADSIRELEAGVLTSIKDDEVVEYVTRVGRNLAAYSVAPEKQYTFVVLDDSEANAMNIGGGRIYINLGMLVEVESEDELAGILAHEIAHDAFQHAPKTVTRQLYWMKGVTRVKTPEEVESALKALLEAYEKNPAAVIGESLLGFSRFDELEADRAAFYNTYNAGYNPRALASVLKRIERKYKQEMGSEHGLDQFLTFLFGSHPPTPQRGTAISWESNFVKMPPKESRYNNAGFDAMKARVAKR